MVVYVIYSSVHDLFKVSQTSAYNMRPTWFGTGASRKLNPALPLGTLLVSLLL